MIRWLRLFPALILVVFAGAAFALSLGEPLAPVLGAAFIDDFGYITTSDGLDLYDVTDPQRLRRIRQIRAGGDPSQVVLDGERLYVLEPTLIRIYDVSDPSEPTEIAAAPIAAAEIAVEGELLVARGADPRRDLVVFDVMSPSSPAERSRIPIDGALGGFGQIEVERGILYAVDGQALRWFDLADPQSPEELPSLIPFTSSLASIRFSAEDGWLAIARPGLSLSFPYPIQLWDVGDPRSPVLRTGFSASLPGIVRLDGDRLHVVDNTQYSIIDITDLDRPFRRSSHGTSTDPFEFNAELWTHEDVTLVRVDRRSVFGNTPPVPVETLTIDTTIDDAPVVIGSVPRRPGSLALAHPHAYIWGPFGFSVIDVGDPAASALVGELDKPNPLRLVTIAARPGFAFLPQRTNTGFTVDVIDATNPQQPVELTTIPITADGASIQNRDDAVFVFGERLYVIARGVISVFDISDPALPVDLGVSLPPSQRDLFANPSGDRLYTAGESGFSIWDLRDPASPVRLGHVPGALTQGVAVDAAGRTAYVDVATSALDSGRFYDISNPTNPVLLSGVRSSDGHAEFFADQLRTSDHGVLRFFDISNLRRPFELGRPAAASRGRVATRNRLIYRATSTFEVVDPGPEYEPALEVAMELRPRTDVNPVNPLSEGSLRLSVYGSEIFDVADVRPESLALGPDRGLPSQLSIRDSDRDGRDDASLRFPVSVTGIAFGDTHVCVRGSLTSGRRFRGCDAIHTGSACGLGFEVAPLLVGLAAWRRRRAQGAGSPSPT